MTPRTYKCKKCGAVWFATAVFPQSVRDEEDMAKTGRWTHGKNPLTGETCGGTWELHVKKDPGAEL